MKSRLLAGLMASALLVSLTACGPGGGGSTSETVSDPGSAGRLETDVPIEEGTKPMDEGLTFDGKTFKLAMSYKPDDSMQRKIDAFNAKFNAKVEMSVLDWDQFNTQLATAQAGGTPYDIIFYHSEFFPGSTLAGLLEPLEKHYTKKDFFDAAKPDAGGLNFTLTENFFWKKQSYGVASRNSVFPEVMYYNKLLFRDAGFEDPMELYNAGTWTWEKLKEMAKEVTDPANMVYFLGGFGDCNVWLTYNGVSGVVIDEGVPRQNLQDEKFIKAMNEYKDLYNGANAIVYNGEETSEGDLFNTGKSYVYIAVSDAYSTHANAARNSNAFAKDVANLGTVPLPKISTNPDKYPIHAAQGWAAGKGSADPRAAVAFAKFESSWTDTAAKADSMPAETRKLFNGILDKGLYTTVTGFQNNEGQTYLSILNYKIGREILQGGDVASVLNNYRNAIQKCVVDSTNK